MQNLGARNERNMLFFPLRLLLENPLYTVKIWRLNWFSKTLKGQEPVRKYGRGDQTKDGRKKKGGVRSHQSDAEETGGE